VPNNSIIFHIRQGVRWAVKSTSEASKLVKWKELTSEDMHIVLCRVFSEPRKGLVGSSYYKPSSIETPDNIQLS